MSTNILKFRLLTCMSKALFLPVASFWVGIIISSLLAAHQISIVVVLYNLGVPSYLITFGMPAGG